MATNGEAAQTGDAARKHRRRAARRRKQVEAAHTKRRDEAISDGKAVAFYGAAVNTWAMSAMELDKSLLTLASGAIVFSFTAAAPKSGSDLLLFLHVSSVILFLVTIACSLLALQLNKKYIENLVTPGAVADGTWLRVADLAAIWSFGIAAVLLTAVGIWTLFSPVVRTSV